MLYLRVIAWAEYQLNLMVIVSSMQLGTFTSLTAHEDFRNQLANHISSHRQHYEGYITTENFTAEVADLRTMGHWETSLADVCPLAVANLYRRPIRIFSSDATYNIRDILPDMGDREEPHGEPILLAHIAARGREHYDAAMPIHDTGSSHHQKKPTQPEHTTITPNGPTCSQSPIGTPQKSGHQSRQMHDASPQVTPHKAARYRSPKKKSLTRKRKREPSAWKRNIKKAKRASGQSYIGSNGKIVPARTLQPVDCSKCRFKCSNKVTDENRKQILDTFWSLADYDKQRHFLCSHVTTRTPKRTTTKSRSCSNTFCFTVDDVQTRVCQKFFLATLNIGRKTFKFALKGKVDGAFVGSDSKHDTQCRHGLCLQTYKIIPCNGIPLYTKRYSSTIP